MRTLWDGITASNIPTNAELVAGYVEGRYVWSQADWNRFPNSIKVTIAIWNADADVLDIETGDATPAMGPTWVARQRARGAFPTVYCNRSTWPSVQGALAAAGFVNGTHYDLWLADYTQVPHCPSYAACCQYADPGPYDLSLCQDYWPRGATGGGDMPLTAEDLAAIEVVVSKQNFPLRQDMVEHSKDIIDALTKAQPTVDVEKLATLIAAKLPPGGQSVDPAVVKALATAVVNEIGVRVRPA